MVEAHIMTKSLVKFETMVILINLTSQPGLVSMQQVNTHNYHSTY